MRFVLAMVLAGLVALPLSASAQPAEEDSLSSWQVDEGASLEQPAPEKPALELKLDEAGLDVAPGYPPPDSRRTHSEELERQKKKRRRRRIGIGVGVTLGAFIVGTTIAAAVALPW
jgi:hypothetical protein